MTAISHGLRAITITGRVVVAVLCIVMGMAAACVAGYCGSGWILDDVEKIYPPQGELRMPSDQVMTAAYFTFLAWPFAIAAGSWVGVDIGARLVGPKKTRR
jgi:hypothetical protein